MINPRHIAAFKAKLMYFKEASGEQSLTYWASPQDIAAILSLIDAIEKLKAGLEWYRDVEHWSCRLRKKYVDRLKWYDEAEEYFQDPHDLPVMKDGGDRARSVLAEVFGKPEGEQRDAT